MSTYSATPRLQPGANNLTHNTMEEKYAQS